MELKDKSVYTLIQKSSNAVELQKEGSAEKPKWYTLSEKVKTFVKNLNEGEGIQIGYAERGDKTYLNFIVPVKGFTKKVKTNAPSVNYPKPDQGGNANKGFQGDLNESIVKQVALKSTAEIVASIVSTKELSAEEIVELSGKIFDGLYAKVQSPSSPSVTVSSNVNKKDTLDTIDGIEEIQDTGKKTPIQNEDSEFVVIEDTDSVDIIL